MTYYSDQDKELSQAGIQEGGLAIYTGTVNPRQTQSLNPNSNRSDAYVYLWQDGRSLELDAQFRLDRANLDVLEVKAGGEEYAFLRDRASGYMRQVSRPAKPIIVANIGAIPLRVDTLLGKFTVYAGTMIRLDEDAPRRGKKKVLLTVSSQYERPLKSADFWDGGAWRGLNIREEPVTANAERGLAVLDGSAIVQYLAVKGKGKLLLMDPPEPDPDYEVYITAQIGDRVTMYFDRRDYQGGRVVQRSRTFSFGVEGEPDVYDLQKLRESQTQAAAYHCDVELRRLEDEWKADLAPTGQSCPAVSHKLRAVLEDEDGPDALSLEPGGASVEDQLEALFQPILKTHGAPVPEPPEDFPE